MSNKRLKHDDQQDIIHYQKQNEQVADDMLEDIEYEFEDEIVPSGGIQEEDSNVFNPATSSLAKSQSADQGK